MEEIIYVMLDQCQREQGIMLVTVVAGAGSAPRSAGACMVVGKGGRLTGTIGGGMLEYKATETAQKYLAAHKGGLRQYRLTRDGAADLGMVCGGDVDVLLTYVAPTNLNRSVLGDIRQRLASHQTLWLVLPMSGMGLGFFDKESGLFGLDIDAGPGEFIDHTQSVVDTPAGPCFVRQLRNTSRVYVFGGGHLAQELVPLLSHLEFRCIVTDDRAEFSTAALFPDAEETHTLEYTGLDRRFDVEPEDYIVAITRGHFGDFEVLRFALQTPAYYIGAVGSRSKIAAVNAKLKAAGFTDADIARVTTPIGIEIKSETPAEIAVSIAAQLILWRANYNALGKGATAARE